MIIFCGLISFPVVVNAWYTYTIQLSQYWAADSGKHLDWSGSSKYISQFRMAVNKWNSYKSGVIREDFWNTVNDLKIYDVEYISSGVVARTSANTGKMEFATRYMDGYNSAQKQNVCIHELGYALVLAHRNESDSVMQEIVTSIITLSEGAKRNYDEAYKRY